ncbi:hypothetical protein ABAC460_09290 [Asticcacaulis sp. AC460]|uniref:DUF1905 domain-containing protein n=1 Tax=Asticcacaulis sp. AC460 TaxID=1282360 RepID=UPI0003C3CFAA|nr:DUF1905 domain-containing protein [Asticcacaulis sp. AC460]ESQ90338.1 hypothetical protein ABAC460_09290 [Asticcacaulis sp. AC460]
MSYSFTGRLWRWQGEAPASWIFVTLPGDIAFEIKCQVADRRAWGSVAVEARIGATAWHTSLFPEKAAGSYLLPIKASVRKTENLGDGDEATIELTVKG